MTSNDLLLDPLCVGVRARYSSFILNTFFVLIVAPGGGGSSNNI